MLERLKIVNRIQRDFYWLNSHFTSLNEMHEIPNVRLDIILNGCSILILLIKIHLKFDFFPELLKYFDWSLLIFSLKNMDKRRQEGAFIKEEKQRKKRTEISLEKKEYLADMNLLSLSWAIYCL